MFFSIGVLCITGLGAPVGSAIVGTADFISRATRVRKALGGGMRQSGVVAAAALEGLRKQLPRIGEDHANAGRLAQVGVTKTDQSHHPRLKADPESTIMVQSFFRHPPCLRPPGRSSYHRRVYVD